MQRQGEHAARALHGMAARYAELGDVILMAGAAARCVERELIGVANLIRRAREERAHIQSFMAHGGVQ